MFHNIQIDLLILKTYYGQFTLTTKTSLHIFKSKSDETSETPPSSSTLAIASQPILKQSHSLALMLNFFCNIRPCRPFHLVTGMIQCET